MKCSHCDNDSEKNPERFYERNGKPRTPCKACDNRQRRDRSRGKIPSMNVYQLLYKRQGGKCAICGEQEKVMRDDGTPRRLAIDHCHSTGQVRGLLCTRCNLVIGQVGDNIRLLVESMKYLIDNSTSYVMI